MRNALRCLVAITTPLLASSVLAYPIRPVPLWELVERAERIVLAEVIDEVEARRPPIDLEGAPSVTMVRGPGSLVLLSVHETWKGATEEELQVTYSPGLICPAPPRYEVGRTVVAFLKRGEAGWWTVGLSYGTLYPAIEEVRDYRELVKEAVRLQSAITVTEAGSLDWLVDAASRPGTRWHGLYQLVPRSDELHSFYDAERIPALPKMGLSLAHLKKIAVGFVASPPVDRTLPMALAILSDYLDQGVDYAAVSAVEALLVRKRPPWWIRDAMSAVLHRFGDAHPGKRLEPPGEPLDDIDAEALRRIWRNARQELLIPRLPPAEEPEVEVWGVGSNTPS